MSTKPLPKGVTPAEAPYLDATPAELRHLADRLIERGEPYEVVRNLVGWLTLKATGIDASSPDTKSRYRKILAELDRRPRRRAPGAGSAAMTIFLVTVVVGASLIDRRPRRSLSAQRLYITTIVGVDVVMVIVVIEVAAVSREIDEPTLAPIHTLCGERRPGMHTASTLPKAA
jgi:hypothetical protein